MLYQYDPCKTIQTIEILLEIVQLVIRDSSVLDHLVIFRITSYSEKKCMVGHNKLLGSDKHHLLQRKQGSDWSKEILCTVQDSLLQWK